MPEKSKKFLESYVTFSKASMNEKRQLAKEFIPAAVDRMEEISKAALSSVEPIPIQELPLMVASFKVLTNLLYNTLDEAEKKSCGAFTKICRSTLIAVPPFDKGGQQK